MKKIRYYIMAAAVALGFASCDLDTYPTNYVDEGLVFSNVQNAEYVLNGTWAYLWETTNTWAAPGWSTVLLASDYMGSDVVEVGNYGFSDVYRYNSMALGTSSHVVGVWTLAYKAIDNMNTLIHKIDGVEGDETHKQRVKAQAYALRGYIYFNLGTFYSEAYSLNPDQECVPIYTEPAGPESEGNPKSTLRQVLAQAESDLKAGYDGLSGYERSEKYKIDRNVAAGVLSRLYMLREEWEDVQKYAALAQEGYSWMTQEDYLGGFNDLNNAEWIWGQGSSADQTYSSYTFNYKDVSSISSGYYSMMADPYFKNLFDENDIRYQLFDWSITRAAGFLMYKKFVFKSNSTADIVIMRKAEMVLNEAEAYAEMNQLSEAIRLLNELRTVRGANTPDLSGLSKADLIEEILIERRKELFGEGFSLSDIKRTQGNVVRREYPTEYVPGTEITIKGHSTRRLPDNTDFVPNSPYYNFTIPSTEIANNPNINN